MNGKPCPVPENALLQRYVGRAGCYTDCYETTLEDTVALSAFVRAFYSTWLFRLERAVLSVSLRRMIRDTEVTALAEGAEHFAAWSVEMRMPDEILLCDLTGRTRSYLAVCQQDTGGTRLFFGSAVVPAKGAPTGDLGKIFALLLPLHRIYARLLLWAARHKLGR